MWPEIEDASDQVEIDDKDLRIDTFRSSGAGGQHVNVTDSAVRITHLPSGIVVSCQNETKPAPEQGPVHADAWQSAWWNWSANAEKSELAAEAGESKSTEWGSQIRSYVLQPYQQVKDERSGMTSGNPEAVLDGDVEPFMEAWLRWRRASKSE